ncbi:MAG: DinB family protein [Candidatus Solibacter sp.]
MQQVLDSWSAIRQDTAGAVEDFPAEEMAYRPTPELATFGEIARHILDASDGLTGMLLAGEENFASPDFRERLKPHMRGLAPDAPVAELVEALKSSVAQRTAQLAAQPAEWFAHVITRFDGAQVTRLEMVQTVKEHELTHRSQLFMYLRLKGLVPATTRRRLAKQAAR